MTAGASGRREALLLAILYVGVALALARSHAANVDARSPEQVERKLEAHRKTLANEEPDPYQYKFFAIAWAVEGVHRATGLSVRSVYIGNTYLSLLVLLFAHHAWLASLYGRRPAVAGTLLLAALAHALFLGYWHHPYEFWGVAGFCLLLEAAGRGRSTAVLAGLALATGLVWEKHALVPVLWAWNRWRGGQRLVAAAARGALVLACALAWFVAVRWICGTDRPAVDDTPLADQRWRWVLANQLPFALVAGASAALAWRRLPAWVRLLWWYVPALVGAYVASRFILHEPRSFWALVPVVTATFAAWFAPPRDPALPPAT